MILGILFIAAIYTVCLHIAAKKLKVGDTAWLTAGKVSLLYVSVMWILQYLPYMKYIGFIFLLIPLIKYFYKIELKKTVYVWLLSYGILSLIVFVVTLPLLIYKIMK